MLKARKSTYILLFFLALDSKEIVKISGFESWHNIRRDTLRARILILLYLSSRKSALQFDFQKDVGMSNSPDRGLPVLLQFLVKEKAIQPFSTIHKSNIKVGVRRERYRITNKGRAMLANLIAYLEESSQFFSE